jgi:hypothetical protein
VKQPWDSPNFSANHAANRGGKKGLHREVAKQQQQHQQQDPHHHHHRDRKAGKASLTIRVIRIANAPLVQNQNNQHNQNLNSNPNRQPPTLRVRAQMTDQRGRNTYATKRKLWPAGPGRNVELNGDLVWRSIYRNDTDIKFEVYHHGDGGKHTVGQVWLPLRIFTAGSVEHRVCLVLPHDSSKATVVSKEHALSRPSEFTFVEMGYHLTAPLTSTQRSSTRSEPVTTDVLPDAFDDTHFGTHKELKKELRSRDSRAGHGRVSPSWAPADEGLLSDSTASTRADSPPTVELDSLNPFLPAPPSRPITEERPATPPCKRSSMVPRPS